MGVLFVLCLIGIIGYLVWERRAAAEMPATTAGGVLPPPPWSSQTSSPQVIASAAGQALEPNSAPAPQRPRARRYPPVAERLARIAALTPPEIDHRLESLGYRGQPEARRAACVAAYRHLRRLQRIHLDGVAPASLPPRDNLLLVGPTGCGKTHLVELLFREVLEVPTLIVDITTFSETGYVGNDVSTILTRLVEAADGDPAWAACGVACIDEFDKLASSSSTARFAGAGTTKDVSGYGVQRSLLALLSAESASYPMEIGPGVSPQRSMPLAGLTFVACGAFSGLSSSTSQRRALGFGATSEPALDPDLSADTSAFERYGILPEIMGRFCRVVALEPLGRDELRAIGEELVAAYAAELKADGLALRLGRTQLEDLVERALRRGTGARGLRAEFHREVVEAQYARLGARQLA